MRSSNEILAEINSLRDFINRTMYRPGFIPHDGDGVGDKFAKIKLLEEELKQSSLQEAQAQEKERLTRQLYSFRGIEQGEDQ